MVLLGNAYLGSLALGVGSSFTYTLLTIIASPVLLALSPYNLHTYPTWLVVNGVRTYAEQSPFYDILDGIKFVASIEIIKIHGLLAAAALFTFVGATLTNYFTHKILDRIYPKGYRIDDLRVQSGNMNHSENFRKFMRDLAARSESALDENDKQILLQLDQCTLTPERKRFSIRICKQKLMMKPWKSKIPTAWRWQT